MYAKLEKTFKRVLAYRDKWPDGGNDKALANVTKWIDKFQQCREMFWRSGEAVDEYCLCFN